MFLPHDLKIRVRRRLRTSYERARYRLGLPAPKPGPVELARTFRHPIACDQKALLVSRYRELFPEAVQSELAEAHRLAMHRFSFLGHEMNHEERIAWSRDPVSGRDWNRGFSADIIYRGSERVGDIKLPWELSKHQYFFTLGKAAWLTGDASPALEIVRQIDDWIDDNPCDRGIHWISALETGTRAVSWIMAYPFYAEYCDTAFRSRLAESLAQHMLFVEGHLSTGPFMNTHVVGEAATLVAGGLFLDCGQSRRWLDRGLAILEEEVERQAASDGVHVERSIAYHRFFLDQYYLVSGLLRANGLTLSAATLRQLERMTNFLMDVLFPDGSAPAFGDCDDARGLWFRADCTTDYRSLLALGAALFGRGDFKAVAEGPTEELLWLFGNAGVAKFLKLSAKLPDHASAAYPDGGYYVMRGGWNASDAVLVFDCGPLGHGPGGHGHADALSFQLHAKGYSFLVDPGAFSYNLDYSWRDAFRSTRAHNTVAVDGLDQSIPADRMSWRKKAAARCHRWLTTPWFDLVDGEHDGYHRLADPVSHRRITVFIRPDVWLICDRLGGKAGHKLEVLLHLRPDCSIDSKTDATGVVLGSPDRAQLHVCTLGPRGDMTSPEILLGSDAERAAWFSPAYGVRTPTRVLCLRYESMHRCEVLTCLSTSSAITPVIVEHGDCLHVEVRRAGGHKDTIFYCPLADHPLKTEGKWFDGEAYYSREAPGKPAHVWASGFRELSVAGLLQVRSPVRIESLGLNGDLCSVATPVHATDNLEIVGCEGLQVVINGRPLRRPTA